MLPDELSATMNDHKAAEQGRSEETSLEKPTTTATSAKPMLEQQDKDDRVDSRWSSPEGREDLGDYSSLSEWIDDASATDSAPPASARHVAYDDTRPGIESRQASVLSLGSTHTLTAHVTPGQLALSAMRLLPVPLLVLTSFKTVVLANEAMARLLGLVTETAEGEPGDWVRGQRISHLGIDMIQDGRPISTGLEQYLDTLISRPDTKNPRYNRMDGNRQAPDSNADFRPSVELDGTALSDPPATVDVLISTKAMGTDSTPLFQPFQRRAKMIITHFAIDNIPVVDIRQPFFSLTFTDIEPHPSPISRILTKTFLAETPDESHTGLVEMPDSTNMEQLISRIKENDEERFETMCDAMPQLVWTARPDGYLEFYNRRWYEYTGLTEEDSVGQGWMRALHPDDLPQTDRLFQRSLKTGEPFVAEYRCRSHKGGYKWFISRALPFKSKETGKIERWFGTCTDVNESIESRRDAEQTWQQLLTVISHAQVTVVQVDSQRRVRMLEGAMAEEGYDGHDLGRGPRWYSGRDMYKVFGMVCKSADEKFLKPIESILAGHPTEILEEGEIEGRYYRTHFMPIGEKDENGHVPETNIEGVIGVIRDVTELKSKEADIDAQVREKQELMASAAAAKEASKLKSQFLANMSHEIRTPITGVIGMAELLLDLDLGEEQREFTENIYRSANALLTVINDILDFSKVESGRLDIEEVQFSLSVIVQDVDKMLSFAAQRKNLDFSSDISDDIVNDLVVLGDPGRVRQIITNLLTNSIKFTNQGHVKFSVLKESETNDTIEIRFVIEDTGIGIEEEVRKRLFVPFSQGDASTARKFGGTGLGLTICKSLLDLMLGRITLESTVGRGTTATFWIPFKKPSHIDQELVRIRPLSDQLQSDVSVSGEPSSPDADMLLGDIPPELASSGLLLDGLKPPGRRHRHAGSNVTQSNIGSGDDLNQSERSEIHILVVEDNAINQQIATKTIRKLGFTVAAAWNGKEALNYLAAAQEGTKKKPNIILMDVQMPVIDGYKATHLLRYHLPYKNYVQDIPIVAMTASAIQGDREKCRKAGMDDYLAKPVRRAILERMLLRWTSPRRPGLTMHSSHSSEISVVACSHAGEHCDNADIPSVGHDEDDDDDDDDDDDGYPLDHHPLDIALPLSGVVSGGDALFLRPGQQQHQHQHLQSGTGSRPEKPPFTRSDTEETQLARKVVARNDLVLTAKRTISNETDSDLATQSRHIKLYDAAGAGPEQLLPQHSPEPEPASGAGAALTRANIKRLLKAEEHKSLHLEE